MKIIAFGDIHMAAGKARQIPIRNPGMLRRGGWVTVHINQSQLEIDLQ